LHPHKHAEQFFYPSPLRVPGQNSRAAKNDDLFCCNCALRAVRKTSPFLSFYHVLAQRRKNAHIFAFGAQVLLSFFPFDEGAAILAEGLETISDERGAEIAAPAARSSLGDQSGQYYSVSGGSGLLGRP